MKIEIRLLSENELSLANSFFNNIYKLNRTQANFEWEFLHGPKGKAIYVGAIDTSISNQKIVGIQCAIPLEFIGSDGTIILTAKSEDTLVDPAYRGQQIFEKMYSLLVAECAKAGIQYIWGFTPAKKAFERIDFKTPFTTRQGLLVIKPIAAFRHLIKLNAKNQLKEKFQIFGLTLISYLKGLVRSTNNFNGEVQESQTLAHLFLRFYQTKPYFHLNQSTDYITWRHVKNPYQNHFENLVFSINHAEVAQVSTNIVGEVGYIEQVLFSPTVQMQDKIKVINKACALLKSKGASLIRTLTFNINEELMAQERAFSKSGFTILNRGSWFVWRATSELTLSDVNPKNLLLNRFYLQGNN